jgi:hypothetical protein
MDVDPQNQGLKASRMSLSFSNYLSLVEEWDALDSTLRAKQGREPRLTFQTAWTEDVYHS